MGAHLMKLPVFAEAINKCQRVLKPKGVDVIDIITNPDPSTFDTILHSFVGIAAVQVIVWKFLCAFPLFDEIN
jgi:fatty acid synthase